MLRSCHDSLLLAPVCLSDHHLLGGSSEGASAVGVQLPSAADDGASHGGAAREAETGDRGSAVRRDNGLSYGEKALLGVIDGAGKRGKETIATVPWS